MRIVVDLAMLEKTRLLLSAPFCNRWRGGGWLIDAGSRNQERDELTIRRPDGSRSCLCFAGRIVNVPFSLPFRSPFSAFLLVGIAFSAAGCGSRSAEGDRFEKTPLTSMYATNPNDGIKRISLNEELPFQDELNSFLKLRPRASNLFLTRAKDVNDAIEAAIRFDGRSVLPLPKGEQKTDIWLVVFFGFSHSNPVRWAIESVESSQSRIKVNFTVPRISQHTQDFEPYFVLVPLKDLKAGAYELQLRDSTNNEISFTRKVRVQEAER